MKKVLATLMMVLSLPTAVFADGMVIPPNERYISEAAQKAAIFYKEGKEDLFLSTTFKGDAEEFGWIVPTPSKPQIKKAPEDTFAKLAEYTVPKDTFLEKVLGFFFKRPKYSYSNGLMDSSSIGAPLGAMEEKAPKVTVYEEKQVGALDSAVIKAESSADLLEWAKQHKFNIPKSGDKILSEYIEKGWYFVVMKVSTEYLTDKTDTDLKSGAITPIRLTFDTDKVIYPLKISSVITEYDLTAFKREMEGELYYDLTMKKSFEKSLFNKDYQILALYKEKYDELMTYYKEVESSPFLERSKNIREKISLFLDTFPEEELILAAQKSGYKKNHNEYQDIDIYLFSESKMTGANYNGTIGYAENLSKRKINSLIKNDDWFNAEGGYFLTKISFNTSVSNMTQDLLFKDSTDNTELYTGSMNFWMWMVTVAILPLLFLYFPITFFLFQAPLISLLLGILFFALAVYFTLKQFKGEVKHPRVIMFFQGYVLFPAYFLLSFTLFQFASSFFNYYDSQNEIIVTVFAFLSLIFAVVTVYFLRKFSLKFNFWLLSKGADKEKLAGLESLVENQKREIEALTKKVDGIK